MRAESSIPGTAPHVSDAPGTSGIHIAGSADTEPNTPLVDLSALSALHLPVEPGLLALRLKREPSHDGLFDGAWWPHSRDIHAELPGLVTVLSEHLGPIERVGLDADVWDGLGEPLFVAGRLIEIDWFPLGDDTVVVTRGLDNFALLAIAPDATVDEAHAAMTMATHIGNTEAGQQILVATGIARPAWQASRE